MEYWILSLLLLVAGLGLVVLEVFFPSGGILGFLCFCSIVGSVILGFRYSVTMGSSVLVTALVGVPVVIMVALHWLPDTAIGRKIILDAPRSDDVLPDDPRVRSLKDLVNEIGRAKSKMLPAGVVKIGGRTIDCVSEGMAIEPGQWVRVIEVRGNRVVVRPLDEDEIPKRLSPDDPLSQPIDSVAADPFDEEDEAST
ncbi:MAG: NfeD family protein [Pirellulales bacterium]|nr:NfeD family protein [Pirellulales bacterium]